MKNLHNYLAKAMNMNETHNLTLHGIKNKMYFINTTKIQSIFLTPHIDTYSMHIAIFQMNVILS